MNDQYPLIGERSFSFRSFLSNLIGHFFYGDEGSSYQNDFNPHSSRHLFTNNINTNRYVSFPFECHPGPIDDAIIDSSRLSKTLFLFIYSRDNGDTFIVNDIFQQQSIKEIIQHNYIFYPLEATSVEGWKIATSTFKFRSLPLFALIRPRGTSLAQSQIFMKHEGSIGETALLSYISIENQNLMQEGNQNNNHAPDNLIIAQQDEEFRRAVEEAQMNQLSTEEIERDARRSEENRIKKINDDFNAIPIPQQGENKIVIKFLFPDNVSRTREFPENGTLRMLFAFARKFEDTQNFVLLTGFPMQQIEENDNLISTVCKDKHFVIHVDEDD